MRGYRERAVIAHNADAWLAWHTAALSAHVKKLPSIQKLLIRSASEPERRQTWREQKALMAMFTKPAQVH